MRHKLHHDKKETAEIEGFTDVLNIAKGICKAYQEYKHGNAKTEIFQTALKYGKRLCNAYYALSHGAAEKESTQQLSEDLHAAYEDNRVAAADEDTDDDKMAKEELIFSLPALGSMAYYGYKLYKDLVKG